MSKHSVTNIQELLPVPAKDREEGWELDLNDLYSPHGKYTPEEKLYAVVAYMVEGNSLAASKRCGINAATIRDWKTRSMWWDDAMREARRKYQDQLDSKLTDIIHTAMDEVSDRITNGDSRMTKDGDIFQVPMTGRDLAMVAAILYDKRALIRGDPTSNPGRGGSALDALAEKFENFTKRMEESGNLAKPVRGEVISGADILGDKDGRRQE